MEDTTRDSVSIHLEYFNDYKNIIDNNPEWKSGDNLKLFTITVLIGKYIVGEKISLEGHKKPYFKLSSNEKNDDMFILKSIAIMEHGDISILANEDEMFNICEEYTTAGIIELKKWYERGDDIVVNISNILLEKFNENLEKFFNN